MNGISDLTHLLTGWLYWLRLRRAATWAWRGLATGLGLALVLGIAGLLQARLLRSEFLALAGLLALLIPLISGAAAYLWPTDAPAAARRFDREFHLQERISTALELAAHPGEDVYGLRQKQLEDALSAARKVNPNRNLPLRLRAWEGLLALVFAACIGLLGWRGETWFQAAQQRRSVEQAVGEQAAGIEILLQEIDSNPTLSKEQKEALTAPLEQALEELQANPSLESSVSVLTRSSEKMQALPDIQAAQAAQALQQAGRQLARQEGSPLQDFGKKLSEGDFASAALDLQNLELDDLNQAWAGELAGQLEAAAETLATADPQTTAELRQAAQALREGDAATAKQALERASKNLARIGQQAAFAQAAQQTAGQLQQGAGEVIAAGGGQGEQAQASSASQEQGNAPGGQMPGSGTGGSGTGEGQNSQTGGEAAGLPFAPNASSDGGERLYEQIHAPTLAGGEGGPEVGLPGTGEGGELVGVTGTNPSEPGGSQVPYSEVYPQYEEINNQVIESGQIPAQFIQIIRDYFNALEP